MKHTKLIALLATSIAFLTACDESTTENITQVNQVGMDVVSAEKDLPECTAENEGTQAFVKGESSARVCVGEEWVPMASSVKDTVVLSGDTVYVAGDTVYLAGGKDTVYVKGSDLSCKTEPLADSSGLKIICNGDSIGVLMNGAKGEKGDKGEPGSAGAAGAGCSVEEQADTARIIICGEDTTVIRLDGVEGDGLPVVASLTGIAYQSFYLKGSSVYIYELSDGRTLKQTGTSLVRDLLRDDGFYKYEASELNSQYAMIVFDGFYNNVVTGKTSNAPIALKAITDMRKHSMMNANLITHLEYNRAYRLVIQDGYAVKKAKKQAMYEILQQFHMDTTSMGDPEMRNMFGADIGGSKLLALYVLLQGDRNEGEFRALLTEIANDITEDGEWNDSEKKLELADWARGADKSGRLDEIRENIVKGTDVALPDFIKYIRNFWMTEIPN